MLEPTEFNDAMGNAIVGLAAEVYEQQPETAERLATMAYGCYRQSENTKGMNQARKYFQDQESCKEVGIESAMQPLRQLLIPMISLVAKNPESVEKTTREAMILILKNDGLEYLFEQ